MDYVGFVGDGLTLARFSAFCECFGEEGEHFFDALALEEAVGGEVAGHGEWFGVFGDSGAEDCYADYLHCVSCSVVLLFSVG